MKNYHFHCRRIQAPGSSPVYRVRNCPVGWSVLLWQRTTKPLFLFYLKQPLWITSGLLWGFLCDIYPNVACRAKMCMKWNYHLQDCSKMLNSYQNCKCVSASVPLPVPGIVTSLWLSLNSSLMDVTDTLSFKFSVITYWDLASLYMLFRFVDFLFGELLADSFCQF